MTADEFRAWLREEVAGGRLTPGQMDDLVKQQTAFIAVFGNAEQPLPMRREFNMKIVGFVSEQMRTALDIHELFDVCQSQFPKRMVYFEPIGFDLL